MSNRPILSLKRPPPAEPAPPVASRWKCKPCGAPFEVAPDATAEHVRCPKCNAKLGLTADFQHDPPRTQRLRARPDTSKPVAPEPAPPKLTVERVTLRKRRPLA